MSKFMKKSLGILALLFVFLALPAGQVKAENIVIVIDPGHGGTESGAHSTWNGVNYYEEFLNLKIAQYAKAELETYSGVTVYMTRTTNMVTMDREMRVKFAKSQKADALVSIHLNSGGKGKISGALAMVPSLSGYPYAEASESQALAKVILAQLQGSVGVKNRGFLYDDELGIILYGMKKQNETIKTAIGKKKGVGTYRLPSMIIEHCFLDNRSDCINFLSSEAKLKKLGVADAAGIARYYGLKKTGTAPDPAPVVKNGWQTENGKKCYYINDVKVKNKWKKINSKYYYFDVNGYLKTGPFRIGKKMYITDENGVRQTGLVEYRGRHYYAGSNGLLRTGWQIIDGRKYYFSPTSGRAYKGLKKIGKQKYYFHPVTGVMQKKWVKLASGRKMYFRSSDGAQVKSKWLRINKKYYYIGQDGYAYVNTKKRISGKIYKFNSIGVCTNRK